MEDNLPDLLKLSVSSVTAVSMSNERTGREQIDNDTSESDDQDEDDQWDDEDGDGDAMLQAEAVHCLFCDDVTAAPEVVLKHCTEFHHCDLTTWVKKQSLPTEDVIRMINYIRKEKVPAEAFIKDGGMSMAKTRPWSDDQYMRPVHPEDHGLSSLLIWDWDEPDAEAAPFPAPRPAANSRPAVDLLAGGDTEKDHQETSRDSHQRLVDDERNASYFDSYSGFNIHCEMLRDKVRTESYRQAIEKVVAGKTVLDIGCGTGVLSCFAARAGATMVVAVDRADIINFAQEIAQQNNLAERIRFIHGDLDQVRLPVEKVDVIVSEWMGYFLLFEGMLDSVISARDKYLAPGGTMIPSAATLFLTAVSDEKDWQAAVGFWDVAYGLKFACLKKHNLRYPSVLPVDPATVMVQSDQVLRAFDLMACTVEDLQFASDLVFLPTKSCDITALIGYFDVGHGFPGQQSTVMFSTSPKDETTHWAQSVFYLDRVFPVTEGVAVNVRAVVTKSKEDTRGLRVVFSMETTDPVTSSSNKWTQTYEI